MTREELISCIESGDRSTCLVKEIAKHIKYHDTIIPNLFDDLDAVSALISDVDWTIDNRGAHIKTGNDVISSNIPGQPASSLLAAWLKALWGLT